MKFISITLTISFLKIQYDLFSFFVKNRHGYCSFSHAISIVRIFMYNAARPISGLTL